MARATAAGAPTGVALAVTTCHRRLDGYGTRPRHSPEPGVLEIPTGGLGRAVECEVSPFGPAPGPPSDAGAAGCGIELLVQAMSGLMAVNGRDEGRPARIGLEVASVAAGILATQGVLAALVGAARGSAARTVRTSLLQAALLACSHYIARATGDEDPTPARAEPAPGPPFRSLDGCWFEIETLDPDVWRSFWQRLGAPDDALGRAWTRFRPRYFAGSCTLPPGLHEATTRHSLAELSAVADSLGVSLCPLRGYDAVVADLGGWLGTPGIAPLDPGRSGPPTPAPAGNGSPLTGTLPLEGLQVVEATNRMQGPLAGLLLRMLGATVIKVEPPGGDIGRMVPPMAGDTGAFFLCFNRGKQPLECDLSTPSGRADLLELLGGADVFLHNWRPGRDRNWSLGPGDLAPHNPSLIYARASGWGARPELDHLLGMDFPVQAFAGLGYGLTPPDEPPRTSRLTLTDFMGALVTCEGILAALYARLGDGLGRQVEASLLAGGMTLQAHVLDGLTTGREAGRCGGRPVWGPLDQPIETADGALVVGAGDGGLARLAAACGLEHTADLEHRVAERIGTGTAAGWHARLDRAGVPCAVVRTELAALSRDPALRGLLEPLGAGCCTAASPWTVGT
ncbi:MAG: CoA transferase [Pseudonocardiaceae bacterium]|nr:CoA transferase [Pseudonocardiaceae bacterium]